MTAQTPFAWLFTCALAAAGLQQGDGPAAGRLGSDADSRGGGGASQKVLRISKDDRITSGHLAELRRKSVTARDLLDRVANLPATILILRAHPLLAQQAGVYGRGRFWINGGELFGYLQYQTQALHNLRAQCAIVHELAHAVEIATADRSNGTPGLRAFVASRALDDYPLNWRGAETEFPRAVANAVLKELLGHLPERNAFEALAQAYHIALPAALAARSTTAESPRKP